MTRHQGHVVPNPQIVLIYWDQYFTNTPAAVTTMDQFVSDLANGSYWDLLSQYGVGAASLNGHVVIDMTTYPTPNSQNPGQSFSEGQMQSQLVMRSGYDQVMFLNRTDAGDGRVLIADFSAGNPPAQVKYWENWGQSPLLNGWEDGNDWAV